MHTAGQRGPSAPKNFPASSLINTEPAKLLASQTDMADHVIDGCRRPQFSPSIHMLFLEL